jgi:hypothetical protein
MPTLSLYRYLLDTSNAIIHECITGIYFGAPFILGNFPEVQNISSDLRAALVVYLSYGPSILPGLSVLPKMPCVDG